MRLDQFLVKYKNIETRTKAQALIDNNLVEISQNNINKILTKASFEIPDDQIELFIDKIQILESDLQKYVSRAALKLKYAIQHLKLDLVNYVALDVGQSTGGFTESLLECGVSQVVGFDVGQSQLHPKLKENKKVLSFEGLNAKEIDQHNFFQQLKPKEHFDIVVCDVSFISLTKIFNYIEPYMKVGGQFLVLVKPQFECGPQFLDKNGIVNDKKVYTLIEAEIKKYFSSLFHCSVQYFESELTGKDGNQEFFIYGIKK